VDTLCLFGFVFLLFVCFFVLFVLFVLCLCLLVVRPSVCGCVVFCLLCGSVWSRMTPNLFVLVLFALCVVVSAADQVRPMFAESSQNVF
jgi:hypothetical protein